MPPAVLGTVRARDSSSPPDDEAGLPWHVILAAIAIYLLGRAEWHWLYILPVLWLLKCAEDQRRRRLWNRLYATASAAVASVNTSESVTWLNQIFRAVWQMYERPIGRYALAILQTKVNQNIPKRIGVTAVTRAPRLAALCAAALTVSPIK
jgi:Ca2+-dependent lipid-binding protein